MVVSASDTSYFNLPPFPYGEANIVPVHIIRNMNHIPLIFTIFKHSTLIAWLNPVQVRGKPIMHIKGPLHAIVSEMGTFSLTSGVESLSSGELSWIRVYLNFAKETQTNTDTYSDQRNLRNYQARLPERGSDAKLVFDISRCKCLILSGTRSALRSFASYPQKPHTLLAGIMYEKLSEIAESVKSIQNGQRTLKESADRMEARIDEVKGLLIKVSDEIRSNPARIASILESKTAVLKGILREISVELKNKDPQNAKIAEGLRERLASKAARAADFLQILQFVTGIATAQMLGATLMQGIENLLRYITSVVG